MKVLEIILTSPVTVILAALLGYLFNRLQSKKENEKQLKTNNYFLLVEKYNSKEYLKYRRLADSYLEKNNKILSLKQLLDYNDDQKEKFAISMVLNFYKIISMGTASGFIDEKVYEVYFRDNIKWWYNKHFYKFRDDFRENSGFKWISILIDEWEADEKEINKN